MQFRLIHWRDRRLTDCPPVVAKTWLAASVCLSLGACAIPSAVKDNQVVSRVTTALTPYRMDVLQGNVVTQEQAARVKEGMSRAQVRDILGSPMLVDPFRTDRWDYVFLFKRGNGATIQRSLSARFDGDALLKLETPEGDLPSESEFVTELRPSAPGKAEKPVLLELTEEQRRALPTPVKPESTAAAAKPAVPADSYPPLEPQ